MSNTDENDDRSKEAKPARKRSVGDVLARRREQLDALRARAAARRQKEKEARETLLRQMAQLQARERRRQRELERDEAREVVRHLGALALDALIKGQEVGTDALALDWASILIERRQAIERVVTRGRAQGGIGAAEMTAETASPMSPDGDIYVDLGESAT